MYIYKKKSKKKESEFEDPQLNNASMPTIAPNVSLVSLDNFNPIAFYIRLIKQTSHYSITTLLIPTTEEVEFEEHDFIISVLEVALTFYMMMYL